MKANKISVIVPVFNVENYLEKCKKHYRANVQKFGSYTSGRWIDR